MPCDYSKYPINWKKVIVPRILKRAENRCEVCGLENKQTVYSIKIYMRTRGRYGYRSIWVRNLPDALKIEPLGIMKKIKVILTIAHLDHDEGNWDVQDDRLQAMCQKCHLSYDQAEKYRRITKETGCE
jgi:hypothetical protein